MKNNKPKHIQMKKLFPFILVLFAILVSLNSNADFWRKTVRGNGHVIKETREVGSFNGISASSGVNVYLFHGEENKVVVEADENLQECVMVKIDGTTLKCYIDCDIRRSKALNVYVNFTELNKIAASSGADVYGETLIVTDQLLLNASSAADIKIETIAGNISAKASSGADIVLKGKAGNLDATASSDSDINAKNLKANTCILNASSGSDIIVTVSESIDAKASSGSDIIYYGNPQKQNVSTSSGADIKRK